MKFVIVIISLLLIPLIQAETTFFDNPDEIFIINNPETKTVESVITGSVTGGGSGGGCLYEWKCTDWSECSKSRKQTRNCTNIGDCPNAYKTPRTEQNCIYSPKYEEQNATEEIEKPKETELTWEKVTDKKAVFVYFVILSAILSIIFYSKRD